MQIMRDKYGNTIIEVYDNRYDRQVDYVSTHLREEDFNEVFASTGRSPHYAVRSGWDMSSRRWMVFDGNANPVAVLGVRPAEMYSPIGIPWLLGTEGLDKMKRFFLKMSKPIIEEMKIGFEILINFVDARYTKAVRWLRWCGFIVDEPVLFGALNLPYHRFYMEINNG